MMAMLTLLGGLVGVALIGTALFDALETIVVVQAHGGKLTNRDECRRGVYLLARS